MSTDPKPGAADLVATEVSTPMSASKLLAVIPRTETLGSEDREVTSFAASRLSGDTRSVDDSAQRNGRDRLTVRERDVLAMVSQGFSNKRIAQALEISPETVKSHVKHIFLKLQVSTRTEAVFRALSLELAGDD